MDLRPLVDEPVPGRLGLDADVRWQRVRVASYGANSGTTPDAGVIADLVFYDPANPPASIAGKIVVVQTEPETEKTPPERRVYIYPGDYLYLSLVADLAAVKPGR